MRARVCPDSRGFLFFFGVAKPPTSSVRVMMMMILGLARAFERIHYRSTLRVGSVRARATGCSFLPVHLLSLCFASVFFFRQRIKRRKAYEFILFNVFFRGSRGFIRELDDEMVGAPK